MTPSDPTDPTRPAPAASPEQPRLELLPPELPIGGSPAKLAGLFALGALMTMLALGVAAAGGGAIGWIGAVFFAACTVLIGQRLLDRGPIVTLSHEGIRDRRLADAVIGWGEVEDVTTWAMSGQRMLVLKVPDSTWERLPLKRITRISRGTNRKLGADGLPVTGQGLEGDFEQLLLATLTYWKAATGR